MHFPGLPRSSPYIPGTEQGWQRHGQAFSTLHGTLGSPAAQPQGTGACRKAERWHMSGTHGQEGMQDRVAEPSPAQVRAADRAAGQIPGGLARSLRTSCFLDVLPSYSLGFLKSGQLPGCQAPKQLLLTPGAPGRACAEKLQREKPGFPVSPCSLESPR